MAEAKKQLKAISDYPASLPALSFDYDSPLVVVTNDNQKLALVSFGRSYRRILVTEGVRRQRLELAI